MVDQCVNLICTNPRHSICIRRIQQLLLNIRHETDILKFEKDKDFLGKDINLAQSVKDLGDVCMYVTTHVDCDILTTYFYSLAGDDFD